MGLLARGQWRNAKVLQDKLGASTVELGNGGPTHNIPGAVIDTLHRGTDELISSATVEHAVKAGDKAPPFPLKDSEGQSFISLQMRV